MTITELWDDPVKLLKWYSGKDLSSVSPEQLDRLFYKVTGFLPEDYTEDFRLKVASQGATLAPKRQTYKQFLSECLSQELGLRRGTVKKRQLSAVALHPDKYAPEESCQK